MLTQEALRAVASDTESDRIERTTATADTDKFSEAVCAFANDLPNHREPCYLIIGVDDGGKIVGAPVTDQVLQNLGAIRSNGNVLPIPSLVVYELRMEGEQVDVAVVEVAPSDQPPVRYKGRTWIRVGPRRAVATVHEERLLAERRSSNTLTFDAGACVGTSVADLSLELFTLSYQPFAVSRDIIEENHRPAAEQLGSLRFFDFGRNCATYSGVLLFGIDPLRWLPGAYIQFVRFSGNDLASDVREDKTFSGDLITVLRDLDSFVDLQTTSRPTADSALHESNTADYPADALRELLINAIVHRTYESSAPVRFYWFADRVEIQNPGGLYGEATPENFPRQNAYRNPVLAEALKTLGYVNRYGRGVYRAREALRANGNAEPRFEFRPEYVLVTVYAKP